MLALVKSALLPQGLAFRLSMLALGSGGLELLHVLALLKPGTN